MGVRIGNTELQGLVQLQELDLELKQLREKVGHVPAELAALARELAESRQSVEALARNQEEGNKERRRLEGEVETLRQKLSKYKDQLMSVKTNKEYQAMLLEISTCEKEISAKEDQILEQMVQADDWEENQRHARQEFQAKETEIQARCRELETFLADSQNQISQLEERRRQVRETINSHSISLYERIATVRQGIAVSPALNQSCQACHVRLRPQLFNDVKTNTRILTCESCNRILYYPNAVHDS